MPLMDTEPNGAMVAVFSQSPDGRRYLLLHNVEYARGQTGDWAWGPPSGCLEPGEDIAACAARELLEETGIRATPVPVVTENIDWAVFFLEVPWGIRIELSPTEHNDFAWVTIDEAFRRCRPERLTASLRTATVAIHENLLRE
jgi:8-oxo-dGTP pyrophosphatase MutT (NUDIX family)